MDPMRTDSTFITVTCGCAGLILKCLDELRCSQVTKENAEMGSKGHTYAAADTSLYLIQWSTYRAYRSHHKAVKNNNSTHTDRVYFKQRSKYCSRIITVYVRWSLKGHDNSFCNEIE